MIQPAKTAKLGCKLVTLMLVACLVLTLVSLFSAFEYAFFYYLIMPEALQ